jgi:hypothetical protein
MGYLESRFSTMCRRAVGTNKTLHSSGVYILVINRNITECNVRMQQQGHEDGCLESLDWEVSDELCGTDALRRVQSYRLILGA